ncbi:MAG: hypothetical protein J6W52_12740 [Bacteroidaceae bacterium]|nr:hypothetical protein [Bacteroidaceae bacterium]
MKKFFLFLSALVYTVAGHAQIMVQSCVVDAYNYLNAVRQNPAAYSDKIGVDLSNVEPRPALRWNEALIKAAQAKAEDMATRGYFAHVDPDGNGMNIKIQAAGYELLKEWYENPAENNFESLGCGTNIISGESVVNMLIIDKGTPSLGHRKHLLGIVPFWANCYDIGIGHAENPNSRFVHYWCFLIAKHDF